MKAQTESDQAKRVLDNVRLVQSIEDEYTRTLGFLYLDKCLPKDEFLSVHSLLTDIAYFESSSVKKDSKKIKAILQLVNQYYLLHNPKKSKRLLEEAFLLFNQVSSVTQKGRLLPLLIDTLERIQEFPFLESLVQNVSAFDLAPQDEGMVYSKLYVAILRTAISKNNKKVVREFEKSFLEMLDKAEGFLKEETKEYYSDRFWLEDVKTYYQNNRFKEAKQRTKNIHANLLKVESYLYAYHFALKSHLYTQVKKQLISAAEILKEEPHSKEQLRKTIEVAKYFSEIGSRTEALEMIELGLESVKQLPADFHQIELMGLLVNELILEHQIDLALSTLDMMSYLVSSMTKPYHRLIGHIHLANLNFKLKLPTRAQEILYHSKGEVEKIKKESCRLMALTQFWCCQLKLHKEIIPSIEKRILETAEGIEKDSTRWRLLQEAANKLSQIQEFEKAEKMAKAILDNDWSSWVKLEIFHDRMKMRKVN